MYTDGSLTGCCVVGWIFEIALVGLLLKATEYGGGTDMWNVSRADVLHFVKVSTRLILLQPLKNIKSQRWLAAARAKANLTLSHS